MKEQTEVFIGCARVADVKLDGLADANVIGEGDRAGELLRHVVAVCRDVADLARGQPELGSDHRDERNDEHHGDDEIEIGHPRIPIELCENYRFLAALAPAAAAAFCPARYR